jgi:hypothetical protein
MQKCRMPVPCPPVPLLPLALQRDLGRPIKSHCIPPPNPRVGKSNRPCSGLVSPSLFRASITRSWRLWLPRKTDMAEAWFALSYRGPRFSRASSPPRPQGGRCSGKVPYIHTSLPRPPTRKNLSSPVWSMPDTVSCSEATCKCHPAALLARRHVVTWTDSGSHPYPSLRPPNLHLNSGGVR